MSWGYVAAAAITAVSANQSRQDAKREANRQDEAAKKAADASGFKPYDVSGAFGQATIDTQTGQAGIELTPEMQELQGLYQQQALGFAGQGQTALGEQAGALGQDFLGQINADPYAAAESQFSKMEDILNPARQRQREALESRLLRQGRLGSTGGSLQQQSYESAVEESRQKGLFDALSQSQAMQGQQAALGTQLGAFGQAQENVGFEQAQARLGGLSSIDQQALQYLNLGSSLGGRQSTAGAQAGLFGMQGAAAKSAAALGASAGQSQAYDKIGGALKSYFNSDSTNNNYQSAQIGNDGSTSESLLASDDQNFFA